MKRLDKRRLVKRALRSAASREIVTKAQKPKARANAMRIRPHAVRLRLHRPRMDMLVGPRMAAVMADGVAILRGDQFDYLNAPVIRPEHHPGGGRVR